MDFYQNEDAEKMVQSIVGLQVGTTLITSGYSNIVVIAGEDVYRLPRNEADWRRDRLEYAVFEILSSCKDLPIPTVNQLSHDPPYAVLSLAHGDHYSDDLHELDKPGKIRYAKEFARVAYLLHSNIYESEFLAIKTDLKVVDDPIDAWENYMPEFLLGSGHLSIAQQDVAKRAYKSWVAALLSQDRRIVVHDDLHTSNIFFSGSEITGLIDFGDITLGSVEQEFRFLYRVSEEIVRVAITEYERLSGRKYSVEAVINWATTHEIAVYSKSIKLGTTHMPQFARSVSNLNKWFPECEW